MEEKKIHSLPDCLLELDIDVLLPLDYIIPPDFLGLQLAEKRSQDFLASIRAAANSLSLNLLTLGCSEGNYHLLPDPARSIGGCSSEDSLMAFRELFLFFHFKNTFIYLFVCSRS